MSHDRTIMNFDRSSELGKILVLICFFLGGFNSFAQDEGNIWYFGQNAGIDFNGPTPVPLTNGALNTFEGCATISDNNGNVLFYTDGSIVYNSNHLPMPNGLGLLGDQSSTQSAIIVKKPGSSTLYYIFTVDFVGGTDGVQYSIVDMNLQGGLGDVTSTLNIPIVSTNSERITAISHQNGTDFWILTTVGGDFHSYLLTSAGLSLTPVISSFTSLGVGGYLKSNSSGDRAAIAFADEVHIYDFDQSTGILSNEIQFNTTVMGFAYGLEFSPNSNLLYISIWANLADNLFQYNLQAGGGNAVDIANSAVNLSQSTASCGALQLGPDNRIYQAFFNLPNLGVISFPDVIGTGCSYDTAGFNLGGSLGSLGLPTFFNTIFIGGYTNFDICDGDSVTLYHGSFSNFNWALSTAPSSIISTDSTITVSPSTTTTYLLYDGNDTVNFIVNVDPPFTINLGNDVELCTGDSAILTDLNSNPNVSYLWGNGDSGDSLTIFTEGIYTLEGFSQACSDQDTIIITDGNISAIMSNIVNESCIGSSNGSATVQVVNGGADPLTITWIDPNGNNFDISTINGNGSSSQNTLYSGFWEILIETPAGCYWDTTFLISAGNTVNFSTTVNHPQCFGTSNGSITAFALTPGAFNFSIEDDNGNLMNNNGTNTANSLPSGTYTVSVFDDLGCENSTTIVLTDPPALEINLSTSHPECFGYATGTAVVDTILNWQGAYNQIYYAWDPNPIGSNDIGEISNLELTAGEYSLEVVDDMGCSKEIGFHIADPDPLVGVVDIVSPTYCRTAGFQKGNGEITVTTGGQGLSGTGNVVYHWENLENGDESSNTTFIVNVPGWMEVTLTDDNNCTYTEKIFVDSLNPIADFHLLSEQFEGPGEFEGTENMEIQIVNYSENFAKPSYELSDTTFKINWQANDIEKGYWFFSYDYGEKIDTVLKGEAEYQVCMVAKNFNDCRDTVCKIVVVHAFPELEVPNVFTPGISPNQEFFFPNRGIETFECSVFNRYGIEVFKFNSIDDYWDGTHYKTGEACKDGIYFYSYQAISTNGTEFNGQGNIHLIRVE